MEAILNAVMWLADNIFGEPAILIGFIVLGGLLLQKKTLSQTISGTFKSIIGFLIITLCADIISTALSVFEPLCAVVVNLGSVSCSGYMELVEFSGRVGSALAVAMAIDIVINVIIATFTRYTYIYLTGLMLFWTTTIFDGVLVQVNENISFWPLVI